MGKTQRPSDELAKEFKAKLKIAKMRGGKNVFTSMFSDLPKADAARQCKVAVKMGLLKQLSKDRWQRTNTSIPLATQAKWRENVETLEKDGTLFGLDFNAEVERQENIDNKNNLNNLNNNKSKTMAFEIDPISKKVISSTEPAYKPAFASQKQKDLIKAEINNKRAQLSGVVNDLSTASTPEVVPSSDVDRLQAALVPITGIAARARQIKVSQGKLLKLSSVSQPSAVSAVSEGSLIGANDITVAGVDAIFLKAASRVVYSNDVIEDAPSFVDSMVADASGQVWKELDSSIVSGGAFCSPANSIAGSALVTEQTVASIAAVTVADINSLLVAAKSSQDDQPPVLIFSPSFFRGPILDLLNASGVALQREDGKLFWGDHEILLSDGLAGSSASASGEVLAVAGSIKRGVTLVERNALSIELKDEILAENDQTIAIVSARYGVGISDPNALSRLAIA